MRRRACLIVMGAFSLLATTLPAEAAGESVGPWILQLAKGDSARTTISVVNRCSTTQQMAIEVGAARAWLRLPEPATVQVGAGATVTLPVTVDAGSMEVGAYDATLTITCRSCPADPLCSQADDRIAARLKVLWTDAEIDSMPGSEAVAGQLLAVLPAEGPGAELRPLLRRWRRDLGLRRDEPREPSLLPLRFMRLRLDDPQSDLRQAFRALQADPAVLWVQPLFRYRTAAATAEPYAGRQWGAAEIGAPRVLGRITGRGVRVAVLDSAVDEEHPELRGRVAERVDLVEGAWRSQGAEIHGTAVAGILAARHDNGLGIYGIAPGVEILAARVCREISAESGVAQGDSESLARGLDWAASSGAQVVQLSLVGPRDPLVHALVRALEERGVSVVAAAGNEADGPDPRFPAAYRQVLAVSSFGLDGQPFAGALHGDHVELLAPGEEILAPVPGGGFRALTGSSFAAPHVSAALALLLELDPGQSPAELRHALTRSARQVEGQSGAGRLDLPAALGMAPRPDAASSAAGRESSPGRPSG